eukprot:COSAG05_NODE_1628_length_4372_cov_213.628047_4_plen_69_part_00
MRAVPSIGDLGNDTIQAILRQTVAQDDEEDNAVRPMPLGLTATFDLGYAAKAIIAGSFFRLEFVDLEW